MGNPLDTNQFKHYLSFLNDDSFGTVEITEPLNFDVAEFMIEQDKDGYARDTNFMAEEISLTFSDGLFDKADAPYQLPSGQIVDRLTMGYQFLIEYYKQYGFESEIQYILEKGGVQFITGEVLIDKTDELTYVDAKIIQLSDKAKAKRRAETKVDMFSDTDLDGNPIEPLQTTDILLKAKPIVQNSSWLFDSTVGGGFLAIPNQFVYFNPLVFVTQYGVDDTLSHINNIFSDGENLVYIEAATDLTDLVCTGSNITLYIATRDPNNQSLVLYYRVGADYASGVETLVEDFGFGTQISADTFEYIDLDFSFETLVPRGYKLWIYFKIYQEDRFLAYSAASGTMNITATSTAIDSVIKGVRYIDFIKQNLKSVNGMDIIAPKYDVGGEFYDRFVFSGNLIRRIEDKGFYTSLKDRKENLVDLNGDMQINDNDAFIAQYNDFYSDVDNGGFAIAPSDSFVSMYNERYNIINLEYGFKNYEKDRDEENTIDAVHTETQETMPNKRAENIKKITVDDIYDAFTIETNRKLALADTTALDTDDKVFVIDVVEIAPGTTKEFTVTLQHIRQGGQLKLLSNEQVSWNLLGFSVNSTFLILEGENVGSYRVDVIESNILTLTPLSSLTNFDGVAITKIRYTIDNVSYTNRTNEGFDLIENVLNPEKYANLKYTIRRNLVHWESYMATACLYTSGDIRNTFFKNNGLCRTQFEGGTIYQENENIPIDSLQAPILDPRVYENEIIVSYDDALDIIQKYQNIDTYGGFIRLQDNQGRIIKVYPQKFGYTWATSVLKITGERRLDSDFVEVTITPGTITIDRVGYDSQSLPAVFWEFNNEYVRLFDSNQINLINFTKFDNISVDGVVYDNEVDLAQALING